MSAITAILCPHCAGAGRVLVPSVGNDGSASADPATCGQCRGRGHDVDVFGVMSFWEPWASCVLSDEPNAKDFENRSRPSPKMVGGWIAIATCATARPSVAGEAATIRDVAWKFGDAFRFDQKSFVRGAVVGIAEVIGVVKAGKDGRDKMVFADGRVDDAVWVRRSRWRMGRSPGYCLGRTLRLPEPIPHKGSQSMKWASVQLIEAIEAQIATMIDRARSTP